MWYFRDVLVLPDVRAAMETKGSNTGAPGTGKKKKGLFSRKSPTDSLATEEVPADSLATPKKKGLTGLFGGKKKKADVAAPPKKDPAKKEDEDDGF